MVLDIEDVELHARISRITGDRIRLVLEYPRQPEYRDKVMLALSELLRPASSPRSAAPAKGGTDEQ